MFFPPDSLKLEIQSQQTALWLFSDYQRKESALLAKLPSTAIKAIAQGAKVELLIGMTKPEHRYYAAALTIHDSQDAPFIALAPLRNIESINGALAIARSETNFITLIDEFDNIVCHGKFTVDDKFKSDILSAWSTTIQAYEIRSIHIVNELLDSLSNHMHPEIYTNTFYPITSITGELSILDLVKVKTLDFEPHSTVAYQIDEGPEGNVLERLLAHKLTIMFKDRVFHSPDKIRDTQKREFVDIFVAGDKFNLLISSKAMSLYESKFFKDNFRRVANLSSHAHGALTQLHGAAKSVGRNEVVTKHKSDEIIEFDRTLPIHAIAVISEYIDDADQWNDCINFAREIHEETGAFVHLFDVHEFIYLIKMSSGSHEKLDFMLRRVFETFYEHRTFSIKSTDSSLPMDLPDDY